MKTIKIFALLILSIVVVSCSKPASSNSTGTMTATVNGSSTSFTPSIIPNGNGTITIQGVGTVYTIQIILNGSSAGTYYLGASSNGAYATVDYGYNTYSTSASNTGQVNISAGSSSGTYSGTFSFSASSSNGSINITNGTFSNI